MKVTAGSKLLIPGAAMGELLAEAWSAWPNETGGVLLGNVEDGAIQLEAVIGPGPGGSHGTTTFAPDAAWQTDRVAALWKERPALEYLGDWHTHPRGRPTLSRLDREALHTIAGFPAARQPFPIMFILALAPDGGAKGSAVQLVGRRFIALRSILQP